MSSTILIKYTVTSNNLFIFKEVIQTILNLPDSNFLLVAFKSRQHALSFKDDLTKVSIKSQVLPTPKELSLGCGLSIRFSLADSRKAKELLKIRAYAHSGIYRVTMRNNTYQYSKTE